MKKLFFVLLLVSCGCVVKVNNPAPVNYKITLYSGGGLIRTFQAKTYWAGTNGRLTLWDKDNKEIIISGTYVLEPAE